jgi:molybdenum cofactor cytidylyltransferase
MFAAIILAAGQSKRMGQNKLLMRFAHSTVLETIVDALGGCNLGDCVVVTGHEHERIEALLRGRPVRFAFNPGYATGEMLSSIQAGLRAMRGECQTALLVLGDQPRIDAKTVQQILEAYVPGSIVVPSYQRRRGHPILLDRAFWPDVLGLPPGANLRQVVNAHTDRIRYLEVDSDAIVRDLDTPEDYRHAIDPKS